MKKRWLILILLAVLLCAALIARVIWKGGFVQRVEATAATNAVDAKLNLPYWDNPAADGKHQLDLYLPRGATGEPLVTIFHGGAWARGDRTMRPIVEIARWFAARGVAAAAVSYRLAPEFKPEAQADDAAHATLWLANHAAEYGYDPRKIFLLGHSAGSHLAALIACDRTYLDALGAPPTLPAGVVALAPAIDMRPTDEKISPVIRQMIHNVFGDDPAYRTKLSPAVYAHAGCPPFLFVVGSGDHLVPVPPVERFAASLRAAGTSATMITVRGRGHIDLFHDMVSPGDRSGEAALAFIRESVGR
ncbi:MAG TPA: alpha/beta hydrolase [bacterium]|nr:alpha/beta hydrolase [bacterium]